jgi:hypothetical protein
MTREEQIKEAARRIKEMMYRLMHHFFFI